MVLVDDLAEKEALMKEYDKAPEFGKQWATVMVSKLSDQTPIFASKCECYRLVVDQG